MLVKMNASFVLDLIHNVLLFTSSWPAKAVQNSSILFCAIRTISYCNQRLVFIHFSCT